MKVRYNCLKTVMAIFYGKRQLYGKENKKWHIKILVQRYIL